MRVIEKLKIVLTEIRASHWVKNLFLLAPLIFSGKFTEFDDVKKAVIGFLYFCIASSIAYVINDIKDYNYDVRHPEKKKKRPLAAGLIDKKSCLVILVFLIAVLLTSFTFQKIIVIPLILYLLLNLFYTLYLKNIPIIDIFCIASGFVIRVFAGTIVIDEKISSWMLICTLCITIFMASLKRKKEITNNLEKIRSLSGLYTTEILDKFSLISCTCAIVFYSIYLLSSHNELSATIPFVIFGIFRYYYLVDAGNKGEVPGDVLLADWPLKIAIVLWGLISIVIKAYYK